MLKKISSLKTQLASYLHKARLYLLHYSVGDGLVLLSSHGEVVDERLRVERKVFERLLKIPQYRCHLGVVWRRHSALSEDFGIPHQCVNPKWGRKREQTGESAYPQECTGNHFTQFERPRGCHVTDCHTSLYYYAAQCYFGSLFREIVSWWNGRYKFVILDVRERPLRLKKDLKFNSE